MKGFENPDLRLYFRQQQLQLDFKQAESALVASVVCACILAYFVRDAVPFDQLVRWGQVMGAVAAIRYLLIYAYNHSEVQRRSVTYWRAAFVATLALSGAAWGTATFLLSPKVADIHQMIVLLVIFGFVASAAAVFVGDRLAFAAFSVPAIGIPGFNLLTHGDPVSQKFAGVVFLSLAFVTATTERTYQLRKREFQAQRDSENLTRALNEEKENFKKLAQEMEAGINARTQQLSVLNEKLQTEVFERREAEIAAKAQKARFTAAFDSAPLGMIIAYQATGEIVKANTAACDLFGYKAQELTKMRLITLLCPSEREQGLDLFGSDGDSLERRFLHRRGHVIWGRTSIGSMEGNEDTEGLVVIQIQDLSELKSAHNRLSSLGGAFGTAFEATPLPSAIIDSCGRITSSNPRMRLLLGRGFDNIDDLALATLVESDEKASAKLADFFSGRVGHVETDVRLFKGLTNEIDATINVSRIGEGSSPEVYAVLHIDVPLAALSAAEKDAASSHNVVPLERRA